VNRLRRAAVCACVVGALGLAAPGIAQADAVSDWNVIAQGIANTLRPSAHGQTRGIAMVQGAVYDAVNAIDRGYQPYLLDLDEVGSQPWGSQDAAAATAAHDVLVALAPAQQGMLDAQYAATLAGIPDGPIEDEGVRVGSAAAQAMLASRTGDGFMAPFTFDIGLDPGNWRPAGWPLAPVFDPDPWVGNLRPFLIESPSQFRSEGPNALTSAAYAEEFNEVKELGSLTSTTRTADQTHAAIFWQSASPWSRLARELTAARGLDGADLARLLAMVHLAAADGAIACWNDKYYWQFWRPIAAIREADTDGNPATVADPGWRSLFDPSTPTTPPLSTPAFPDHPSGHGCVSGAVLHTFQTFFGTDKIAIDVFSSRFPGQPRHFDRFSHALKEIIDARVWGGIHFRTADVQGTVIGKKVAHWLEKHYFQPAD
jgi:PAP2 superfamily